MLQLPLDTPPSLQGGYGHVRYRVVIKIDRPWAMDHEFEELFTVTAPVDLNSDPSLKIPAEEEVVKNFCCFICESDPVNFQLRVKKTGYIPGEELEMHAVVNNPTWTTISHLEVGVIKRYTYQSSAPRTKTRVEGIRVYDENTGSPLQNGIREYSYKFQIPNTPEIVPSTFNSNFHVCRVHYVLSVKAYVKKMLILNKI